MTLVHRDAIGLSIGDMTTLFCTIRSSAPSDPLPGAVRRPLVHVMSGAAKMPMHSRRLSRPTSPGDSPTPPATAGGKRYPVDQWHRGRTDADGVGALSSRRDRRSP